MADPKNEANDQATEAAPEAADRDTPPISAGMDAGDRSAGPLRGVPRVISLIVLMAVVLLIGVLFFRVMASFLAPLFLATVLAVVFQPLHAWALRVCGDRPYYAATVTTTIISLLVLAPTAYFAWKAFDETFTVVEYLSENRDSLRDRIGVEVGRLEAWAVGRGLVKEGAFDNRDALTGDAIDYIKNHALSWGAVGVSAATYVVGFLFGLGVMIFALYYFLADGSAMLDAFIHLSPMDDEYERELLDRFSAVSRAVVVATILTAIVQGVLGGVGYFFVMEKGSPVFLLTVLTAALAIVPFIGATAVWAPVAVWVFFMQEGGFWPGIGLAIWGFCVVSTIDNFLKPFILHGQSNLHPLLALLSVLGGLQLLGPIGILVGPLLVAFLQALLGMLRKELDGFRSEAAES
ncbi:MAG: AI-2E family transporter [Planctomycetota bacterium]